MDNNKIIELLNDDLKGEHGAIIQYLQHAFSLGETAESAEIIKVAREEMYHYKMLSEAISRLGGIPTLDRDPMILQADNYSNLMKFNVTTERGAIDKYERHIKEIDSQSIKNLLNRIVQDELVHETKFSKLADELAGTVMTAADGSAHAADIDMLNQDAVSEYTVILQYLRDAYTLPECRVGWELEFRAVEEMRHLEWFSEKVVDLGGKPSVKVGRIDTGGNVQGKLDSAIKHEQDVIKQYKEHMEKVSDKKAKDKLHRVILEEVYHEEKFTDYRKDVDK